MGGGGEHGLLFPDRFFRRDDKLAAAVQPPFDLPLGFVSFAGEAQIHLLEAIGLGKKDIVPAKAKAKLLRAWMLWRLVTWQSFWFNFGRHDV